MVVVSLDDNDEHSYFVFIFIYKYNICIHNGVVFVCAKDGPSLSFVLLLKNVIPLGMI